MNRSSRIGREPSIRRQERAPTRAERRAWFIGPTDRRGAGPVLGVNGEGMRCHAYVPVYFLRLAQYSDIIRSSRVGALLSGAVSRDSYQACPQQAPLDMRPEKTGATTNEPAPDRDRCHRWGRALSGPSKVHWHNAPARRGFGSRGERPRDCRFSHLDRKP